MILAIIIWITGLFTAVPYAVYRLLFVAERNEYAFLIAFPLFWVLGYWSVVAPLLLALKIRRVMKILESCRDGSELDKALCQAETEDVAAQLIASENRIPLFAARWLYRRLRRHIRSQASSVKEHAT